MADVIYNIDLTKKEVSNVDFIFIFIIVICPDCMRWFNIYLITNNNCMSVCLLNGFFLTIGM